MGRPQGAGVPPPLGVQEAGDTTRPGRDPCIPGKSQPGCNHGASLNYARQDCNYHITLIAECLLAMASPHQSCYYCALMTR